MAHSGKVYVTTVTVTGGREGHAVSDDGVLHVQLRCPKLNGASDGTTPEQLFAAAWGGCFQSALMAIAWKTGDDVSGSVVMVEVAQEPDSQGGYGLSATITVDIPAMEQKKAQELANGAIRVRRLLHNKNQGGDTQDIADDMHRPNRLVVLLENAKKLVDCEGKHTAVYEPRLLNRERSMYSTSRY